MNAQHFDDLEGDLKDDSFNIPIESFFENRRGRPLWPDSLSGNPMFVDQIEKRKHLIGALRTIQSHISDPTLSLEHHVREGNLSEEHVADLYEELADLLTHNPQYGRIILYLPFEYLPSSAWKPNLERLRTQAGRLRDAYMHVWTTLLNIHDVRANFVDGDVLETEKRKGDLPRVVKAAHHTPILVQKGWLSVDKVLEMHSATDDDVLRESIADTFGVLYELGFVDEYLAPPANKKTGNAVEPHMFTPERLQQDIEERLKKSTMEDSDATEKRRKWLAKVQKEKVIDEIGDEISFSVEQLTLPTAHIPSQLVLIDGIRKAIERAATKDANQGALLYARFQRQLHNLWEKQHPDTQPYLEKLFFRLHHLRIVDAATLSSLGLSLPSIGGPFSKNVQSLDTEMSKIRSVVTLIRSHPVLKQYLYPVVLMYGSKLKGYGEKNADNDFAVFIQPATPDSIKVAMRDALRSVFASVGFSERVTEFWLQKEKGGLTVDDFEDRDGTLASSLWSHVLFGAAWSGDENAIRTLFADLLPTYFRITENMMFGRSVRELYLEHLEQDLLQYRLMHKGYERYYPAQGGLKNERTDRLDGQSAFWDSGYRAVATKLFVEKVFLPLV